MSPQDTNQNSHRPGDSAISLSTFHGGPDPVQKDKTASWATAKTCFYEPRHTDRRDATTSSSGIFCDYDHGLERVNAAEAPYPAPNCVRAADQTQLVEMASPSHGSLGSSSTITAGADASTLPLTGHGEASPRPRIHSASSSYPSEGMRSPGLAASPPTTVGRRVFSNLTRLGHLSFLRSDSDHQPNTRPGPGITVETEVTVDRGPRTDKELGNTTHIYHGAETPRPSTTPDGAGRNTPGSNDRRKYSSGASRIYDGTQDGALSFSGIYDSLTTPRVRDSSNFSDIPESRASITCLPRNSGNYETPERRAVLIPAHDPIPRSRSPDMRGGAGANRGTEGPNDPDDGKRSLRQKMKESRAAKACLRVRDSLRRSENPPAPAPLDPPAGRGTPDTQGSTPR